MPRIQRAVAVAAMIVVLAACSSDGSHRVASSPQAAAAAAKPAPKSRASAPPVRLFAGVQSSLGALTQFCRGTKCETVAAGPKRLTIADRSIVTFAVDAKPDLAVLDVSGTGARRVSLAAGTLMPFNGGLAPGQHRLSLQLRWGTSLGTWIFDVVVKPKS